MNTEDMQMDVVVRSLRRMRADTPGPTDPAALELFGEIVAQQRPVQMPRAKRTRRAWLPLSAAAAVIAVAVVVVAMLADPPEVAAEPVTFRVQGDYIVASVADPAASEAELEAAFERRGFDIEVVLEPASPSFEGIVGGITEDPRAQKYPIRIVRGPGCVTQGSGAFDECPVGVRIPLDFEGSATIDLGRRAAPGEFYRMTADAFAPGEVLHCSGLRGMPVEEAAERLDGMGLQVVWRTQASDRTRTGRTESVDLSQLGYRYVWMASSLTDGIVEVWAERRDVLETSLDASEYHAELDRGC